MRFCRMDVLVKREIESAYDIALEGLRDGDPIEKYEDLIKKYQANEHYEHCAGIKKAIERYREYKK